MGGVADFKTTTPQPQHQLQLFSKGSQVEVSTDEKGFKGAWYVATILEPPSSSRSNSKKKNPISKKIYVEYKTLLADKNGSKLLRYYADPAFVRPLPPQDSDVNKSFELNDVVDGFHRDGWWTGVVTKVLDNYRYMVTFQNAPDTIEFGVSELRVHREWVNGKWVRPEKQSLSLWVLSSILRDHPVYPNGGCKGNGNHRKMSRPFGLDQRATGVMFSPGKDVEVSLNREDYRDVWFPAVILKDFGNGSLLVEYQSSGITHGPEYLRFTVDSLHIRPSPSHLMNWNFVISEKVEAFYDFGWWSGVITKELADGRYNVFFKHTNKDKVLNQSDLRPHMEWKDGKWFSASQDVLIPSADQEHVVHACNNTSNTKMASPVAVSGASNGNSGQRTPGSINSKENQTDQLPPCNEKCLNVTTLLKKTSDQTSSSCDGIHSPPLKKLKEGNIAECPSLGACQLQKVPMESSDKGAMCGFGSPISGYTGTDFSNQPEPSDQPSAKTDCFYVLRKVRSRRRKVSEQDNHTTEPEKRKGRAEKSAVRSPPPSAGSMAVLALGNAADDAVEKEYVTKAIELPVVTGLECNGMKSARAEKSPRFLSEETLKLMSDQKQQVNDPATPRLEEDVQLEGGESTPTKKRGRPPKLIKSPTAPVTGVGSPVSGKESTKLIEYGEKLMNGPPKKNNKSTSMINVPSGKKDKVPSEKAQTASKLREKHSSKKGNRWIRLSNIGAPIQDRKDASVETPADTESMTEMGIDKLPSNSSDDQPLVKWFEGIYSPTAVDGSRVSPGQSVQQSTDANEIEKAIVPVYPDVDAAIGRGGNQSLPFVKNTLLWEAIESMEVFRRMPQNPHFHPLRSCKESSREGLAVGNMVTFSSLVEGTSRLQIDDPRSIIEDGLETLVELESHGFDVEVIRDRLTGLLLMKDKQVELLDQVKEVDNQMVDRNLEKTKIDEEIGEIEKQIRELQEKRAMAMSMKENTDNEISNLQLRLDEIHEGIQSGQGEFVALAAAPW